MIIPIRLAPVALHIHADRRLAFEVLTAFGARQEDGGASAVLRDEGDRKLVEFHSVIPVPGSGRKIYRTVEWVSAKADAVHRFDQMLDGDAVRIEGDTGLLVPEADVRPLDTLEPLQGPLDRDGSGSSRHPLDGQNHGRGRGERDVRE